MTAATTHSKHQLVVVASIGLGHDIFTSVGLFNGGDLVRGRIKLLPGDLLSLTHQLNHELSLAVTPTLILPTEEEVDFSGLPRHLTCTLVKQLFGIRCQLTVEVDMM